MIQINLVPRVALADSRLQTCTPHENMSTYRFSTTPESSSSRAIVQVVSGIRKMAEEINMGGYGLVTYQARMIECWMWNSLSWYSGHSEYSVIIDFITIALWMVSFIAFLLSSHIIATPRWSTENGDHQRRRCRCWKYYTCKWGRVLTGDNYPQSSQS